MEHLPALRVRLNVPIVLTVVSRIQPDNPIVGIARRASTHNRTVGVQHFVVAVIWVNMDPEPTGRFVMIVIRVIIKIKQVNNTVVYVHAANTPVTMAPQIVYYVHRVVTILWTLLHKMLRTVNDNVNYVHLVNINLEMAVQNVWNVKRAPIRSCLVNQSVCHVHREHTIQPRIGRNVHHVHRVQPTIEQD